MSEFSREALRARLGDEVLELAERLADEAPDPTPEQVEAIRLIFAPHIKRMAADRRAERPARAAA